MSMSIYYEARRGDPLSDTERQQVDAIVQQYAVEEQIEERERTGIGPNWESFCVYEPSDPTSPDVIFEGATKLPDNSEDAMWHGLQHWCAALTQIRRVLIDANWQVFVEDRDIHWDAINKRYDPSV